MNGVPASPMQIVQAHIVREDAVYMRDYVLNDNGDIKELCFDDVEMQEQDRWKYISWEMTPTSIGVEK